MINARSDCAARAIRHEPERHVYRARQCMPLPAHISQQCNYWHLPPTATATALLATLQRRYMTDLTILCTILSSIPAVTCMCCLSHRQDPGCTNRDYVTQYDHLTRVKQAKQAVLLCVLHTALLCRLHAEDRGGDKEVCISEHRGHCAACGHSLAAQYRQETVSRL